MPVQPGLGNGNCHLTTRCKFDNGHSLTVAIQRDVHPRHPSHDAASGIGPSDTPSMHGAIPTSGMPPDTSEAGTDTDALSLMHGRTSGRNTRPRFGRGTRTPASSSTAAHAPVGHPTASRSPLFKPPMPHVFLPTMQWLMGHHGACPRSQDFRFTVSTWFLDRDHLPRCDHDRVVTLGSAQHTWIPDIIRRWEDFIRLGAPIDLHLVTPTPTGGLPEIKAHVLLVQNKPLHSAATLVSVMEMLEDPWHPSRFASFLPQEVSRQDLCREATLFEDMFVHQAQCRAFHGTIELLQDMTYPARDGFGFDVALPTLDSQHDDERADDAGQPHPTPLP